MTYNIGNPGPGLELAQQCGGVKSVNEIQTLPPLTKKNKGLKHFCHKKLRPLMSEGDEPYF
jgi:hypothetical protein